MKKIYNTGTTMYLAFTQCSQRAKLLVAAYPNKSKPELEGLHFIQMVAVWETVNLLFSVAYNQAH